MPQSGLHSYQEVSSKIDALIDNLVHIEDTSGEFLLRLADGRVIDTKGWNGWEWTHGVGLYGMWQYYEATGAERVLAVILDWFDTQLAKGTTKNVNTALVFLTLICVYESDPHRFRKYRVWIDSWIDYVHTQVPRTRYGGVQHVTYLSDHEGQLWDDTLMMAVMPLLKAGVAFNVPEYVNEAKKQVLTHIKYLFDPVTGLFNHGWVFENSSSSAADNSINNSKSTSVSSGHAFACAKWARGNSWITIVVPDILDLLNLPRGDFFRSYLEDTLDAQVAALAALQDRETGLWYTILDTPEEKGNYLEASATAGFAYGILKGIRKGYLSKDRYAPVAQRAICGVAANILDSGELDKTSFGTPVGKSLQEYYDIPITSMPYGQAMAMIAFVEYLKTLV